MVRIVTKNDFLKGFTLLAVALFCIIFVIMYYKSGGQRKDVAILQLTEYPSLTETRKSMVAEISRCCKEYGIYYQNANGDLLRAVKIAQDYAKQKPSLVVAIGTIAAQAAAAHIPENIPIIFSSVADPVNAGLVKKLDEPDKNITGVSDYVDTKRQLETLKSIMPQMKIVGILYNPAEQNSLSLLNEAQIVSEGLGLELRAFTIEHGTDISDVMSKFLGKVDAVFINNDNLALYNIKNVVKLADLEKKPVFTSDLNTLSYGVTAAVGVDQAEIGRMTGQIVEKILKEKIHPSQIPVMFEKRVIVKTNPNRMAEFGLQSFSEETQRQN